MKNFFEASKVHSLFPSRFCHPERSEGPAFCGTLRIPPPSAVLRVGMTIHERCHLCTAPRLSSRVLLYSLSPLGKSRSRLDNFFEHGAATLTHRRVILVLTDVSRKIPTALALQSRSLAHLYHNRRVAISRALFYFDGGDDEEVAQIALETHQHGE